MAHLHTSHHSLEKADAFAPLVTAMMTFYRRLLFN